MHKSNVDVISMSTNHIGATSSLWNTDGRERGNKQNLTISLDFLVEFYLSFSLLFAENFIFIFSHKKRYKSYNTKSIEKLLS